MASIFDPDEANTPPWTCCSTMFCYNRVVIDKDMTNPPFCEACKQKKRQEGEKIAKI